MTTIDLSKAPAWFDIEEPEERIYWLAGIYRDQGIRFSIDILLGDGQYAFDTRSAAYLWREVLLSEGGRPMADRVQPISRSQLTTFSALRGHRFCKILDIDGEIVEQWEVPA